MAIARTQRRTESDKVIDDLVVIRVCIGGCEVAVVGEAIADDRHRRGLTEAEEDILTRLLAGESNAQIAAARGTSKGTVCNQVAAVFAKIGVRSRSELAATCSRR